MSAQKPATKCDKCGIFTWGNVLTEEEVCPVCDLGLPPKKVAGYEQMSQDVLIEERMYEARQDEREHCAKICDELAKAGEPASDRESRRKFHALAEAIYIQSAAYRVAAKAIRQRKP